MGARSSAPRRSLGVADHHATTPPGTGGSTARTGARAGCPAWPAPIERVLDALGYDQVDVLGVSFGGGVAQQLAHQAPDRVRRLVLAATCPGLGGVPGHPRGRCSPWPPRGATSTPTTSARSPGELYGGEARHNPDPSLRRLAGPLHQPPSLIGYLAQLYAIPGWTSLPWLRRLRQPTLVLAGDDDPIVPLINGRMLARLIPDARLHVVPGGGHLFLLEHADEVAGIVADFLTATPPSQPGLESDRTHNGTTGAEHQH